MNKGYHMNSNDYLIRNCDFKLKCNQTWDSFSEVSGIDSNDRKYCKQCDQLVQRVTNSEELLKALLLDLCVAIPIELTDSIRSDIDSFLIGSLKKDIK